MFQGKGKNAGKALNEHTKEELIQMVCHLKECKKFGLVWEDKPEQVAKDCQEKLPILREDKTKALTLDNEQPTNIIIEGDNYHALSVLNYTHAGKIDVIYIDPPYNMGGEWKYNDKIVDSEDSYRHSKWLSFMEKRLRLAKNLLSEKGVVFISIDDHEHAHLKVLCDEIFDESNFISDNFVLDNLKGKANDNFITSVGHWILTYAKNKPFLAQLGFQKIENVFAERVDDKYDQEDDIGKYNLVTFKKTGQAKNREDRPYMFYPILVKHGQLFPIGDDEFTKIYNSITKTFDDDFLDVLKQKYESNGYTFILPLDSNHHFLRWTSGFNTFKNKIQSQDLICNNSMVYQKCRPEASEELQTYASGAPKNLFYKPEFSTGTADLKNIMGKDNTFPFPKPVSLIKHILKLYPPVTDIHVLDFFAGSGTTGQAVLELNKADGGKRQFILCTNNENKIAEEVTYPRIKTVITGNRPDGTKYSEGIPSNVRYFKTDFVSKNKTSDRLRREIAPLCTDMIKIRENCFEYVIDTEQLKVLRNNRGLVALVFDDGDLGDYVRQIDAIPTDAPVYLYVFSYNSDNRHYEIPDDASHEYISQPIPEGVLSVYRRIFQPKDK